MIDKFFDDVAEDNIRSVLVIDFANLVFRTIHISQKNNPTDTNFDIWKKDVTNVLMSYIYKFNSDRVVIALDSRDTWRKSIFPEYKGKRKDARDKSIIDFDKFFSIYPDFEKELMETFKSLIFIKVPTVEADDTIALLAKHYSKRNVEVICVSNDGDLSQLLKYKNFTQWNPITRKNIEIFDPVKYLNAKILKGDDSDNIPNVMKGMGKVTAEKQAGRLAEFLEESEKIVRDNFKRNKMLIDMDLIPQHIQDSIMDCYSKYIVEKTDGSMLYEFFVKNKMYAMIEDSQKYLHRLNKLK